MKNDNWATLLDELATHDQLFALFARPLPVLGDKPAPTRADIDAVERTFTRLLAVNREVGPGERAVDASRERLWRALCALLPPPEILNRAEASRLRKAWDDSRGEYVRVLDGEGAERDYASLATWLGAVLRAHSDWKRDWQLPEDAAAQLQHGRDALRDALLALATTAVAVLDERGAA